MAAFCVDPRFLCLHFLLQIKDELNNPTSEKVKNLKTHHGGHWECCTSDVAGYMFRVSQTSLKTRFYFMRKRVFSFTQRTILWDIQRAFGLIMMVILMV